jgi:hypothetical protein
MFCTEWGQEIFVVEHSICIPKHTFYRSVERGMSGVSRVW